MLESIIPFNLKRRQKNPASIFKQMSEKWNTFIEVPSNHAKGDALIFSYNNQRLTIQTKVAPQIRA